MKTILFLVHSLLFSDVLFAADSSDKANTAKTLTSSPVTTGALIETLIGLLVILACIAFLAWLLRRTGRFNTTANGEMKIIAGLSLGPRERAVLLQVGEQQILVGVTTQHIHTLHVLDQPIRDTNLSNSSPRFAEKLQQIMQQRGNS
ncbi:MAG: flagellar biosynthetic protein FliO [Gammaproteobacteria bacterium]|nr:flagellar biosynthetic protein FliO [Gammaproteobacteria bacterium]MDH5592477.1 flagellar biosynthetic protein FliO [Gammaproteobacteria bacterium]